MIREIGKAASRLTAPLLRIGPLEKLAYGTEVFLATCAGRGGGSGWYDEDIARTLARTTKARVVLDVGANNGTWARQLHRHLPEAEFHLFECAPYCFDDLNALPIAKARRNFVALSDTPGDIEFYLPQEPSGLASMYERRDTSVRAHSYARVTVPATTLDLYLADIDGPVDLLKMDVEGAELSILKGAEASIERINAVMFEFGSANVNSRTFFRDFWDYFTTRGFTLHRFVPGGRLIDVAAYDDSLEYFRGPSNYLALRA